jgi:hypothetical protein
VRVINANFKDFEFMRFRVTINVVVWVSCTLLKQSLWKYSGDLTKRDEEDVYSFTDINRILFNYPVFYILLNIANLIPT